MNFYRWLTALVYLRVSCVFGVVTDEERLLDLNTLTFDNKHSSNDQSVVYCPFTQPNYVWCVPKNYTSEENPFQHADLANNRPLPWNYTFDFNVKGIGEIDDQSQSIVLSMYFGIRWFEPRLQVNETANAWDEVKLGPKDEITISPQNLRYLWYPELEIYGIERFRVFNVLKEMSGLRIRKDRTINYEVKTEVTISCKMDFDNYPLDNQTCFFQVGSYYGSDKTVTCESNFSYDPSKQKNIHHLITLKSLPDSHRRVTLRSGDYSVCGFSIHLTRKKKEPFVQIYMPSFMFVVASWISFIVKPDIVPGRMSMLVVILLVQLNLFNNSKDKAPAANNNINAVDLYLIFSMFLVFSALMEYALVLALLKSTPSWMLRMENTKLKRGTPVLVEEELRNARESLCNKIDITSLCLAPITFFMFHVVYISIYL